MQFVNSKWLVLSALHVSLASTDMCGLQTFLAFPRPPPPPPAVAFTFPLTLGSFSDASTCAWQESFNKALALAGTQESQPPVSLMPHNPSFFFLGNQVAKARVVAWTDRQAKVLLVPHLPRFGNTFFRLFLSR